MAEDRMNLCALKNDMLAAEKLNARITQRQYHGKENQPLTRAFGCRPFFSFLAIVGWACSSSHFNLRKGE